MEPINLKNIEISTQDPCILPETWSLPIKFSFRLGYFLLQYFWTEDIGCESVWFLKPLPWEWDSIIYKLPELRWCVWCQTTITINNRTCSTFLSLIGTCTNRKNQTWYQLNFWPIFKCNRRWLMMIDWIVTSCKWDRSTGTIILWLGGGKEFTGHVIIAFDKLKIFCLCFCKTCYPTIYQQ